MSFKAVNWTPNERIGERKTNQMSDNADWLVMNTPRAIYTLPGGLRRTEGVRLAAGRVLVGRRDKSDSANVTVRFGNYFSPRCEPIITTGIVSNHQIRIHHAIHGIGSLQPDARGFTVGVNIAADKKKQDKIAHSFYITWQAVGY